MSRAGPHVNDPIRLADDIQVMLNHNDRAVLSDKSVDDGHKPLTVGQVKASRRFIEHINFTLLIELCRQLHPRRSLPIACLRAGRASNNPVQHAECAEGRPRYLAP